MFCILIIPRSPGDRGRETFSPRFSDYLEFGEIIKYCTEYNSYEHNVGVRDGEIRPIPGLTGTSIAMES